MAAGGWFQRSIEVSTRGRGFTVLTERVQQCLSDSRLELGLCHVFLCHTSASLCITENADPAVRADLERIAQRLAPDGDPLFVHDEEGPDDMPAHVRSLLAGYELTVPIRAGRLALGTWQGIYLWEHRRQGSARRVIVTLQGQ
jgi:secondary thiamine-phosphate synthase enzyme